MVKLFLRFMLLCSLVPLLLAAGCASVHRDISSLNEVEVETVLLVGRIELVPRLRQGEQNIRLGLDPSGIKESMVNRAMLGLSHEPKRVEWNEFGGGVRAVMNPVLEQTFFIPVPKGMRYMVNGTIAMEFSPNDGTTLMILPPMEFDIRPNDKAIYIGTLRMHRDEFHEVTKTEILDDYTAASAEFKKRFGGSMVLRKGLAKPLKLRASDG